MKEAPPALCHQSCLEGASQVRYAAVLCFQKKRTISNHVLRLEINPFQQSEESFYLGIVMALA